MKRVDALVVVGSLLVTCSLLLPSLLRARELSRSGTCAEHLRQQALGALDYAASRGGELPANRRQPATGWNTLILPFAGQEQLYNQYQLSTAWWEGVANQQVAAHRLSELLCPAAPHGERWLQLKTPTGEEFKAAPTDYVASAGAYLQDNVAERLYRGAMPQSGRYYGGSGVTAHRPVRLNEITDGASLTFLIVEMADKPHQYPQPATADPATEEPVRELVEGFSFGQWIAPNWNHLRSYSEDGREPFGSCGVNCSNQGSVFAFHDGFANIAYADGAVHPVRSGVDQQVMVALVSIADGELVSDHDFRFAEQ